jgi:16S rRNA (adenine1518-N6/adenine1519-N6)-dimethyltransferase
LNHRPRKRFGQNFLRDAAIIDKMLAAIAPRPGQHIVEIGPGEGALTGGLLDGGAQLTAVEIDRDLVPRLLLHFGLAKNFQLQRADALDFDFSRLAEGDQRLRIVGNLPYNISTPLLFHLLQYTAVIEDLHFMLQKEVVQRMAAPVGGRSYGRLSIMVQYACEVTPLFEVPPGAFYPAPKVDSAVLRLRPWRQLPHPARDPRLLSRLVNIAFQQRRKTLRNALKSIISEESLTSLGIDSKIRPENLTLADYVAISNALPSTDTEQHDPAS